MKKILALLLAALMASATLASCGNAGNGSSGSSSVSSEAGTNKESTATAEEVFDAINKAFADKYGANDPGITGAINNMPAAVDDQLLEVQLGISPDLYESYKGEIAGMMTNCDMLIVVKAKEGKVEDVKAALEAAKKAQAAQFENYPVMANDVRIEDSKVVENGRYVALLMVGVLTDDNESDPDFTEDVQMAEDAFNAAIEAGK